MHFEYQSLSNENGSLARESFVQLQVHSLAERGLIEKPAQTIFARIYTCNPYSILVR
jgi:hypothetical protein